jgi:hypothetical protein
MDINLIRSLVTLLSLVAFAGIVWWAYSPQSKQRSTRRPSCPSPTTTSRTGPERRKKDG